jgi:hypothetical protein
MRVARVIHDIAVRHERMLVTEIADSWLRLQSARRMERRFCAAYDMMEILTNKLKEFHTVTRMVTESERAWRPAIVMLGQAQRRRQRQDLSSQNARRAHQRPVQPPARIHQGRLSGMQASRGNLSGPGTPD